MKTRRSQTTRHILMTILALGPFAAADAEANDASHIVRQPSVAEEKKSSARKPQFGKGWAPDDRFSLNFAYRGAAKKLEKVESCRALFDDLSLGGPEALSRSQYRPVLTATENAHCVGGVAAYTVVGAPRVLVCSHFHTLPRRTKAAVLIHEALHTAGMSEAPLDPNGKTAPEITEMVEEACRLSN